MIEIKDVSMKYGPVVALDKVSFSVQKGEILGLLGPNGAGKSTLMRILTTFIYPSEGTALLDGYDVRNDALHVREQVGYLPENAPLYADMRVDEYLDFVGKARGIKGVELARRFKWLKDACGIASVWKHNVREISKGFSQRVGLAQALIHDPKVLILDEPTTGLDPLQIIGIRKLIKNLAKNKTIIFSTHILQEVEALADRIVIINEGKIVSQGTREELAKDAMKYRYFVLEVKGQRNDVEKALAGVYSAKEILFMGENKDGFASFEIKCSFDDKDASSEIDNLNKSRNWAVKKFAERDYNMEDIFISLL
ncbi:MAG: ABC transporter ATP-binding protein, partial [Candidatus Omnitrophica bacterium]|nr:ABC transporter ATP-binding protein [Candidatus Omnitrophota bacterium]